MANRYSEETYLDSTLNESIISEVQDTVKYLNDDKNVSGLSQNEPHHSPLHHTDPSLNGESGKGNRISSSKSTSSSVFDSRVFSNNFEKDMNNSKDFLLTSYLII